MRPLTGLDHIFLFHLSHIDLLGSGTRANLLLRVDEVRRLIVAHQASSDFQGLDVDCIVQRGLDQLLNHAHAKWKAARVA